MNIWHIFTVFFLWESKLFTNFATNIHNLPGEMSGTTHSNLTN